MTRRSSCSVSALALAWSAAWLLLFSGARADASGINTDVGMTPREAGALFRLQFRYADLEHDPSPANRRIRTTTVPLTVVYGLRADTALFLTTPFVHRSVDRTAPASGARTHNVSDGIGDLRVFVKHRFWQRDAVLETARWAGLAGLQVRSGDRQFSSDSYDPLVGTVFTWARERHQLDTDAVYQFNTGRGDAGIDVLHYDVAYSYRLFPAEYGPGASWDLRPVAELNGEYAVDGSHRIFLSPGLQFTRGAFTIESSIQIPVVQHLTGAQPDEKFRFVFGVRLHF